MKDLNKITEVIIGAAIEVHKHLGPGLLEGAYSQCLSYELSLRGLSFRREVELPLVYKGLRLACAFKADLLVEEEVIVELKSVDALTLIHTEQLVSYLRAAGKNLGLLINFNVPVLKRGLRRVVYGEGVPSLSPCKSPLTPCLREEEKPALMEELEATR